MPIQKYILPLLLALPAAAFAQNPAPPRNIVLFIADGLRHGSVNPEDAPTMASLRAAGVDFTNSHSLLPTVTTPNASAIATGHSIADTGDFSNNLFTGFPTLEGANFAAHHPVGNDPVLFDLNQHFSGNYLGEETLISAARRAGYQTAVVGKLGPALIQAITLGNRDADNSGSPTILLDDSTGLPLPYGIPLPKAFRDRLANDPYLVKTYFDNQPPKADPRSAARGDNGISGTKVTNALQQQYFADATTRVVLPFFETTPPNAPPNFQHKPFLLVYWSRDPDGTQHNQGDSLGQLTPGINGPTSKAAVHDADDNLKQLLEYLKAMTDPAAPDQTLAQTTDIFITSDHGFATISKKPLDAKLTSVGTFCTHQIFADTKPGDLPPGFLAIDLAHDLNLPLFDAGEGGPIEIKTKAGQVIALPNQTWLQYRPLPLGGTEKDPAPTPTDGNALIGGGVYDSDGFSAPIIVTANAGSDFIYLLNPRPGENAPPPSPSELARKIVPLLAQKSYVAGIFVDTDRFGDIPGALSLADINLRGSARTPVPAIAVTFTSFSADPDNPIMSAVEICDTGLGQGQGSHGSFGRNDTFNCMIAAGPDFKTQFPDSDPVSNADIAITLSHIMHVDLLANARGTHPGRLLDEALATGPAPRGSKRLTKTSAPSASGFATTLLYQAYLDMSARPMNYIDAAGTPGRTVGIPEK